jgi:tetratricopeptide (TPR) repeat protein
MKNTDKRALSFYMDESDAGDVSQITEGIFLTPSTKAWLQLDDSLEKAESCAKNYQEYLRKLDRLIEKEPDYLDTYNYAGNAYLELASKVDSAIFSVSLNAAQSFYQRAYERAKELIPADFKGRILWLHHGNRPFLRAHHGLILCHLRKKEYVEAARMIEEHLAWNPNDNIGVRLLLGDAYFMAGDTENAKRVLSSGLEEGYPDNSYSLGLLEFKEGNFSAAATALRIGFLVNEYIAEILTGRSVEKQHFYWHSSSWRSVESAKCYLINQDMLTYWKSVPQAIDFVDWLYNCAAVMRERLQWAEIREGLTTEHNFSARGVFVDREEALRRRITKVTMLVQKITDRQGHTRWPWENSGTDLMI